jgi:hypothetical protein
MGEVGATINVGDILKVGGPINYGEIVGIQVKLHGVKGRVAPRDQLIFTVLQKIYAEGAWNCDGPFLKIEMPCGQVCVYDKTSDVPAESVPCPCGDPAHWMIKYSEED